MRKFISILAAFCMLFAVAANAQTVQSSRMVENISVTLDGGALVPMTQPLDSTFFNNLRGSAGFGIDKYFTPVVGIGVQGLVNFNHDFATPTFDQAYGLLNGKVNISNWLGGYNGEPRRVELVGFAGIGYGHNFNSSPTHFTVYDAGAELNFNIGKARAWQINVRPTVLWNNQNAVYPKFSINDADVRLAFGVTYKFGSQSKKSHNFVLCPYSVTQETFDALKHDYYELAKQKQEVKEVEVVKTITEVKEVPVKGDTRVLVTSTVITFPIGSAVLSEVEREKVKMFAKSLDGDTLISIVGSADTKTGTETRNFALAQNRANVVKNILTEIYGIAPSRISVSTQMDATENVQTSRSAILTLSVD